MVASGVAAVLKTAEPAVIIPKSAANTPTVPTNTPPKVPAPVPAANKQPMMSPNVSPKSVGKSKAVQLVSHIQQLHAPVTIHPNPNVRVDSTPPPIRLATLSLVGKSKIILVFHTSANHVPAVTPTNKTVPTTLPLTNNSKPTNLPHVQSPHPISP